MTTDAPIEHVREAQKLTADALVDLYEFRPVVNNSVVRATNGQTIKWRGNTYEAMALRMTGDTRTADVEESRPTLQIGDPLGTLTYLAFTGVFEKAQIKRLRLLREHLEANLKIYEQRLWYVERVKELVGGQMVTLELRNMSEGPALVLPARQFVPPEFPSVTLT